MALVPQSQWVGLIPPPLLGQARPESKDNRFGASLGGYIPKLPDSARTYFYLNYEGRRLVAAQQYSRIVPTDTLRQGILPEGEKIVNGKSGTT